MTRVGLISDTHCLFDEKLKEFLKDVDVIWHAGDIGNVATADAIASFKPLVAVYGNVDGADVRVCCPQYQIFNCEQVKVLMTHIGGYPGRYEREVLPKIEFHKPKIFISGHSHILKVMPDRKRGILHINPGAAGAYGFHQVRTAIRFLIDGDNITDLEVGEWERYPSK